MLIKIISGGQSGVDLAGWRAARAAGLATGGFMPAGYRTEDGPRPEFAELFGAVEMPGADERERTRANSEAADATFWFGDLGSPGARCTRRACVDFGRPFDWAVPGVTTPANVAAWAIRNRVAVLNVAGNRASKAPQLGPKVEAFLARVFRMLQHGDMEPLR